MLRYMRENVGSWAIRILLFGIAIVFAFWGIGSYSDRDINTILTIDKVRVPYSEYRDAYNALIETYRNLYDQIDSETLKNIDIKEQAVETLVDRYLLLEAAKRLNVSVSTDEVEAAVVQNPSFQEGGVFSPRLFQAYLDYNRMTPDAFEASLSRDLTITKVTDLIQLSAVVTPQEIEDNLDLLTRQITLNVVTLDPNLFIRRLSPPSEEELLDFYDENIENYRVPEKFTQAVTIIDTEDLEAGVRIDEEEIEELYAEREKDYIEPASFKLRHILFAFPANATAESIAATRLRAEEVADDIREGVISFEEAAGKWSGDTNTSGTGGELPYMSEDELDPALVDAALSLEKGEISEPVPTSRGFELIGVVEKKEERVKPLAEVRDEIRALIMEDRVLEAAYDLADDLIEEAQGGDTTLQDLAREEGLTVVVTPPFPRGRIPRTVDLPSSVLKAVFDTEEGEVGDVYELGGRLYLFQNIARTESYLPDLEEVRDEVSAGLIIKRSLDLALQEGEEMIGRLQEGETLKAIARQLGASIETTPPFTILERSLPGLTEVEDLVRDAFTISEPGGAVLVEGKQGHYLAVLKEIIPPTEEEKNAARESIENALRIQRESDTLASYVQVLREEYEDRIQVNRDLL
ncbi:MAG: SurA N-terminal domain-containing protein [bacterium]|nr:MAG: SurA N-terminal domain-containing protein [bacterium]